MLLLLIVILFVSLIDTSGLYLDNRLTRLLYVVEEDEEDSLDHDIDFDAEGINEASKELYEEKSEASEDEVMAALEQIYKE